MPWDCFCPNCSATTVCSMTDPTEEMEKEMDEYRGKIIRCISCETHFEFDTGEIREVVE